MNNRYVYARENLKRIIIICLFIGIPMIVLGIYMILYPDVTVRVAGYSTLAAFLITFLIILGFAIPSFKWRNWHKRVKNSGRKVSGKVVDFGYKYNRGRRDEPASEDFWLIVMYFDNFGNQITFETPRLAFRPEKRNDITCDVYIYNNEVLATNFINLNKQKIDWKAAFQRAIFNIFIGIIFIGICFLIAWIKSI